MLKRQIYDNKRKHEKFSSSVSRRLRSYTLIFFNEKDVINLVSRNINITFLLCGDEKIYKTTSTYVSLLVLGALMCLLFLQHFLHVHLASVEK